MPSCSLTAMGDQRDWIAIDGCPDLRVDERQVSRLRGARKVSQPAIGRRELISERTRTAKPQDYGRIIGSPISVISDAVPSNLSDPAVILDHLDRISHAIERDDPAQAIGSAKELVESTAKVVLRECGEPFSDADDLPDLVRKAQITLEVHPTTSTSGPDGSTGVKKILGATIVITTGVAELRNRGYGTGHGSASLRTGLSA